MNIVKVKLSELKLDPNNARKHSPQNILAIKQSLQENPQYRPFVVQKGTNKICVGNGMYIAMQELGIEEGWVEYRDLDDKQFARLSVADNRTAELAEWDEDILQQIISNYGDDITIPGFGDDVSFNLDDDKEITEDEVPEITEEVVSVLGDVWKLGRHRLMCGDSTDAEMVGRLMDGQKADIAFTSPPYNAGSLNVAGNESTKRKYNSYDDQKSDEEYFEFLCSSLSILMDSSVEVFYNIGLVEGNKKAIIKILNHFIERFKDIIYWEKTTVAPHIQPGVINNLVEFILCFGNGKRKFENATFSQGSYWNVIKGKNASDNEYAKIHKATFPMYLPENIISNFTHPGGLVIDSFGGTGTTLIACEQLNRTCYMMELDPKYVDVIIKRWQNLTGEHAINETTKQIFNKVASLRR